MIAGCYVKSSINDKPGSDECSDVSESDKVTFSPAPYGRLMFDEDELLDIESFTGSKATLVWADGTEDATKLFYDSSGIISIYSKFGKESVTFSMIG